MRAVTPMYRLEMQFHDGSQTTSIWDVRKRFGLRGKGQPNAANLNKHIAAFEQSCRNGSNRHLGLLTVISAEIINQKTNKVVVSWKLHPVHDIVHLSNLSLAV